MADAKGYLPPEGPAHGVPYRWIPGQNAHRIGNSVVEDSPQALIVTVDQQAPRACERSDLEAAPDGVVENVLGAMREDDYDRANDFVDEWRSEDSDVADPEDERPVIPGDLDDVDYRSDEDEDLQDLAQAHGIAANQSADELREQLAEARDEEESA